MLKAVGIYFSVYLLSTLGINCVTGDVDRMLQPVCIDFTVCLFSTLGKSIFNVYVIRPVVSASALTWFIIYIFYWNVHFLYNIISNIDNNNLLPSVAILCYKYSHWLFSIQFLLLHMQYKRRYQILCTRCAFGNTFIRYAPRQNIWKLNTLKVCGCKKTKGPTQNSYRWEEIIKTI
jgi:hypothetical protein